MSNRYGPTEREKAIWPAKKELDTFSFMEKCFWFVLFATLLATLIHFTIEPKGGPIVNIAHADTKVLSDKEQEKLYCAQIATGEKIIINKVSGSVLAAHCARFL